MSDKSFLTAQQIRVLKLREKGLTQKEVAHRLGTTRANVSTIEKRAHVNIERARETLEEWEELLAPVQINIPEGTDVLEIPKKVFRQADENGIKIQADTLELITQIEKQKKDKIKNRMLIEGLQIYISVTGEIILD